MGINTDAITNRVEISAFTGQSGVALISAITLLTKSSRLSPSSDTARSSCLTNRLASMLYPALNRIFSIGAKVVSHGRYVTFQMAEAAVSRQMFADILSLIARLRAPPASA
jgi:hypothetical protein